jgi:hypothetical protein
MNSDLTGDQMGSLNKFNKVCCRFFFFDDEVLFFFFLAGVLCCLPSKVAIANISLESLARSTEGPGPSANALSKDYGSIITDLLLKAMHWVSVLDA